MRSPFIIFVKVYGSLFLSLIFLISTILVKKTSQNAPVTIKPPFIDIEIGIPISNIFVVRMIFLLAFFVAISSPVFIDYSSLFPSRLSMEVFYDQRGILESLSLFNLSERQKLSIPKDYFYYQEEYYRDLDEALRSSLGIAEFFNNRSSSIHSFGETTFFVEKMDGIQKYHIRESHGELTHLLELPNQTTIQFKTFFEKLPTRYDYINPLLKEIFINNSIIIRPQFKQILAQNIKAEGIIFHHTVVGVTMVKLFPWPEFSNTIYFANFQAVGLVPIAYAIYR